MSITSRINEMSSHIEQAYDELQGLGADLTNVNKNIENISMVLDDIYDSMPQVSGEGTSLTLDDTRVGKIKSTLKGNTSQTTYSGKNLVKVTNGNSSRNNTTLTIQDNVINFKTTGDTTYVAYGIDDTIRNANYGNYVTWNNMTLSAGTYTLSTKYLSGSTTTTGVEGNFIRCVVYGRTVGSTDGVSTELSRTLVTNSSNSNTFTTSQDMEVNIVIYMYANQTPTVNINFQVQLEKGSSATDFEPYVGGTASPNPSYPQPVNVVSGDNSVVVCGKNLLNLGNKEETTDTNGLTYKVENNVITISGTNTSTSAYSLFSWWDKDVVLENRFQKGSTFTVSSDKSVSGLYFQINYDKEGTSSQGSLVSFALSEDKATFTVPQDFGGINHIFIGVYGTATTINTSFSIQLEYGSTKSSFMPFDMSQYDINLIVSKNIFNINTILRGYDLTAATGAIKQNATWYASDFIGVKPSTNYTSTNISSGIKCWYDKNKTFISYTTSTTATSPVNARYMRVNGTLASIESDSNLMIEEGSSASTYVPYESIELCKIGTPQDYFYKQNGNWYLYKIIYKKIFNDTDTIGVIGTSATRTLIAYNTGITLESYAGGSVVPNILCTHLISASQSATWIPGDISRRSQDPKSLFYILEAGLTTTTGLQWLVNNNVVTYTPMAEPIVTEITYQPLIDQLNLLEKAMSKDGQTNISQVNNDLPFIISASALKEWQESTSLNSTLSMVNPLSLGNTLNTQENDIQPIEVDNIEPLEEEENEES